MADLIYVKSKLPDNRVALHERHPDHPGGEVFVYGDQPVRVARTGMVSQRIANDALVETTAKGSEKASAPAEKQPGEPDKK